MKQLDDRFGKFMVLGNKKSDTPKLFDNFSLGVVTNCDAWAYNASPGKLEANMRSMISFYNAESARFEIKLSGQPRRRRDEAIDGFIDTDPTRISWTRALKQELSKGRTFEYDESSEDFWTFSKAGRALVELHLNYETGTKYPLAIKAKGSLSDVDLSRREDEICQEERPGYRQERQ